ncbi:zinc-containing alcohol dehydrogenase [Minicystis rosea]|nr:zinc-containing alcohol dehydrogenase [Minicystis rosea]
MSRTMKAVRVHAHGGPEVLVHEEVARPEPGPGDVLIRVHAACLNPPDWYARSGFSNIPEALRPAIALPFTPGSDVSGVVEALGEGVTDWRVGDEVFGLVRFPDLNNGGRGYAEYTTSPAAHLARKPAGIDHVHAAAVPMAGLTAWQYLFVLGHEMKEPQGFASLLQKQPWIPAPLGPGRVALVNGAAGGVGHFAAQLAKSTGARVIGVASGRHEGFLRELGVDEVIDYTKTAAEEVVRDVDLVIDTVGGPDGHRFLRTVKRGGMICPVFLGEYHRDRAADLGIRVQSGQVWSDGRHMTELARRLEAGTLRVGIDSVFPLAEASKAHVRAERGHIQGKIVLTVD